MRERDGGRPQRDRERPLDRVRDAAEIKRRAELSRQKEDQFPRWGHAFTEHVDASDRDLQRRAATGVNARGIREEAIPEHATRWQSDAACVITADRLWRTPQAVQERRSIDTALRAGLPARQSFTVRAPLSQVLGANWAADVYGRSRASNGLQASQWRADSQAVAVFRKNPVDGRWYLHTCYPQVIPYHRP